MNELNNADEKEDVVNYLEMRIKNACDKATFHHAEFRKFEIEMIGLRLAVQELKNLTK